MQPMTGGDRPNWFGTNADGEEDHVHDGVREDGEAPDGVVDWFGEAEMIPTERGKPVGERTGVEATNGVTETVGGDAAAVADVKPVEMDGEVASETADADADAEAEVGAEPDAEPADAEAEPEPAAEPADAGMDTEPADAEAEVEPAADVGADTEPADAEVEAEPAVDPSAGTDPVEGAEGSVADAGSVEMDGESETDVPEPSESARTARSTGTDAAEEFEEVEDDEGSGGLIGWIKSVFGL